MLNRFKTIAAVAALAGAAGLAALLGSSSAFAQEIKIRYASPSAASDPTQQATLWFMDEVKKRTNGRVTFETYLGNSLVKDQDLINAIGDGLVEMGKIYTVSYPGQLPLWNLGNLPFTSPAPYVAQETLHEITAKFPAFDQEMAKLGVRPLGIIATGGTQIVSRKPIRSVADLKGFKVRARGVQAAAFTAAGATPLSIPWNDVYEALSKGVVEGSTNYLITTRPIRHNEVAGYFVSADLGQAIQVELVNRAFFDKLPEDIRKVMVDTMREAEMKYAKDSAVLANQERKALSEATGPGKMEFIDFPDAEREKWIAMSPDFFGDWAKQNKGRTPDAEKIAAAYKEAEKKFTEKAKEMQVFEMW